MVSTKHLLILSSIFIIHNYNNVQMSRLDQILGKQGSKAKDVYASKISLASRVVKVERSVCNLSQCYLIF